MEYLRDLRIGHIIEVGLTHGLKYEDFACNCSDILKKMVEALLSAKKTPTWESLITTLQNLKETKVALRIMKGTKLLYH